MATKLDEKGLTIVEGDGIAVVIPPAAVLREAQERAAAFKDVVKQAGLAKRIGGKEYVMVEGWQTLAKFYGYVATPRDVEAVDINGIKGVKAKAVVIQISSGVEVGGAEAYVMDDEPTWKSRPFYAKASMAQTRACGKALRSILAWVAVLAGYEATPAEEMDGIVSAHDAPAPAQKAAAATAAEEDIATRCPFGKNAGRTWASMNTKQLEWYRDHFAGQIKEQPDSKFVGEWMVALEGIKAVLKASATAVEGELVEENEVPL